jgi:hypothetical protein
MGISQEEYIQLMTKKKKSKYWNKREWWFDSKWEWRRYQELLILEKAWVIKDLKTQVRFKILEDFEIDWVKIKWIDYVTDFTYEVLNVPWFEKWKRAEDFKGVLTDVYKIKKKFFLYLYWKEYNFYENFWKD